MPDVVTIPDRNEDICTTRSARRLYQSRRTSKYRTAIESTTLPGVSVPFLSQPNQVTAPQPIFQHPPAWLVFSSIHRHLYLHEAPRYGGVYHLSTSDAILFSTNECKMASGRHSLSGARLGNIRGTARLTRRRNQVCLIYPFAMNISVLTIE